MVKHLDRFFKESMFYMSAFLYLLSIVLGYKAYRTGSVEWRGLALALFVAAIGTTMITFIAFSLLQTV